MSSRHTWFWLLVALGLFSFIFFYQRLHPSAFIADGAQIIGNVEIAKDASIWFNSVLRADINSIYIGERSNIQDGSIVHVTSELAVVCRERRYRRAWRNHTWLPD